MIQLNSGIVCRSSAVAILYYSSANKKGGKKVILVDPAKRIGAWTMRYLSKQPEKKLFTKESCDLTFGK